MRVGRRWTRFFILFSLATLTGCGMASSPDSSVPAVEDAEVQLSPPDAGLPEDVLAARDAVLEYLSERFPEDGPQEHLIWTGTDVTPVGLVGAAHFQFESGAWLAYVVKPVTAPDQIVYHVSVNNPATGFIWKGMVTGQGQVQEDRPMAPSS